MDAVNVSKLALNNRVTVIYGKAQGGKSKLLVDTFSELRKHKIEIVLYNEYRAPIDLTKDIVLIDDVPMHDLAHLVDIAYEFNNHILVTCTNDDDGFYDNEEDSIFVTTLESQEIDA